MCDVRNSTAAVEAGKYKNVNTVGAAAITAVLNAAGALVIAFRLYGEVVARVRKIYGEDDACHPLSVPELAMRLDGGRLGNEVGVRAAGRGLLGRWFALMRTRCVVLLGWFLMKFGIRTADTDWGR